VKKNLAGPLLCALVPFLAMCFSVPLWDRISPIIFGLPFNLFWLISWIVLTTPCLWIAYRWLRGTTLSGFAGGTAGDTRESELRGTLDGGSGARIRSDEPPV
jgi:hypothetical protein